MGLNQFHVSFRKWSRSQHTLCDFKFSTATLTKHDNQTAFVWRWFPFTLKQQKNMFCSQLALSVTCTNTEHAAPVSWRLSSGRWNVTVWHFVQQSCSSFWFLQGYCPEAAETLSCLFHCMWLSTFSSSACDVKGTRSIRGKHVHNRSQTACAISWKIPGLCAISTKTGHNHMRRARHLPLSTLCVGLHAMLQENHHESQLFSVSAIPDEEVTSLHQFYSLLKVVFTWAEVLNMCGMRWSADFVICISSLLKPTNWQQLIKDLV